MARFVLPAEISRTNIKLNGYRFGDYRFTLAQNQVLGRLMDENLYEERYAFVRELLPAASIKVGAQQLRGSQPESGLSALRSQVDQSQRSMRRRGFMYPLRYTDDF